MHFLITKKGDFCESEKPADQLTKEISSSGCISLIDNPDEDSGFLMVGAAEIVAALERLGGADIEAGLEDPVE